MRVRSLPGGLSHVEQVLDFERRENKFDINRFTESIDEFTNSILCYSQLSRKRPPLGHDKRVAYGKDQQNKPNTGLIS